MIPVEGGESEHNLLFVNSIPPLPPCSYRDKRGAVSRYCFEVCGIAVFLEIASRTVTRSWWVTSCLKCGQIALSAATARVATFIVSESDIEAYIMLTGNRKVYHVDYSGLQSLLFTVNGCV